MSAFDPKQTLAQALASIRKLQHRLIGRDFDPPQIRVFLKRANLGNSAHGEWLAVI
jgi:hypothetical protein